MANYAFKGTLRTSREFPGYDVGAGPLNAALGTNDVALPHVVRAERPWFL